MSQPKYHVYDEGQSKAKEKKSKEKKNISKSEKEKLLG